MRWANLTRPQRKLVRKTITTPGTAHLRRIELHLLTLDGGFVRTLSSRMLPGSTMSLDVEQTPMMVATVKYLDRSRSMVFEPDSAGDAPVHRKYMLRIIDARFVPTLGWVECDVFTGPIWDFDRIGPEVTITAHSVDELASGDVRRARMWRRKTRKTDIMKGLLREAGATRLRIPDLRATTPVHVHVGVVGKKGHRHKVRHLTGFRVTHQDTYWDKASGLGDSASRLLFPTADGAFELRSHPERAVIHFGHNSGLLSEPKLGRPGTRTPNVFIVVGAKPKGSKRRVTSGKIGFPAAHPLSAHSLAVNDKPFEVIDQEENPHCKTVAECRRIARRKRDRAARMLVDVSFEAMPVPWLRPWDVVTAESGQGRLRTHVRQMTYPLGPDDSPMVIGTTVRAVPRHQRKHGTR